MKKKQFTDKHGLGFKIPENYFEDFEGRFFSKLGADTVSKEKISTGFKVPDNYFEKFSVAIPKEKETKVLPLFRKRTMKFVASVAAVILFVLSIFNEYENSKISFSTVGYESIESYIEEENISFDSAEIQWIITEGTKFQKVEFDGIDDEDIFDYLINNSSELSFINY